MLKSSSNLKGTTTSLVSLIQQTDDDVFWLLVIKLKIHLDSKYIMAPFDI
jgi:hypothetical protein